MKQIRALRASAPARRRLRGGCVNVGEAAGLLAAAMSEHGIRATVLGANAREACRFRIGLECKAESLDVLNDDRFARKRTDLPIGPSREFAMSGSGSVHSMGPML